MDPDGGPIEEKNTLGDLGVRISTDLSFKEQVDRAVQAGSLMAGWALRSFRGRGKRLMLTILSTIIQPRLDYCSQLWSPRDQLSINKLESVQKHFLLKISDHRLNSMNYWEKLTFLKVYSQERRRERYQICFLWKLSQGLVEGYSVTWQWSDRRGRFIVPANLNRNAPLSVRNVRECPKGPWCQTFQHFTQKITLTFSFPRFLTNPLPQDWSELQPPTAYWTRYQCCMI